MSIHFCAHCQTYLAPDRRFCPRCGSPRPERALLVPRWQTSLAQTPLAQTPGEMLVALGLLFVPTRPGALHALALADGQPRWHRRFEHATVGGLARAGDLLLVSTYSTDLLRGAGGVCALDAAGNERWTWSPGGQRVSAPAAVGGQVYVTVDSKVLVVLDAANGDEQKRIPLPVVATPAAPLVAGGIAYISCRGPHLLAVGLDGAPCWRFDLAGDPDAWLDRTPVRVGGRLVCVSTTGWVIALDAQSGVLRWQKQVCAEGKSLSAPATDGTRLFVGARDGLHALSLDGDEAWVFATEGRVAAAPAAADGVVYVTAHDHRLTILDADSGREMERVELAHGIEVAPTLSDERVIAADRDGNLVAVERVLGAEGYAQRGRWAEAASTHIRRGRLVEAAQVYQGRLGQPLLAAELWRAAGDPARAAPLYEQARAYDRAEVCYARLAQPLKVAEMARRQGDPARAAALFEAAGAWAEARDCYAEAGQRRKAAELSERLGEWARAAESWEALGELARAAAAYRAAQAWPQAASLYERAGLPVQAAACYEKAAVWDRAGDLYEQAGLPAEAVACHRQAGRWQRVGELEQRQGQFAAAAVAWMEAARKMQAQAPAREGDQAALWSAAEACWVKAGDEAQAAPCRVQVARCRRRPYIEMAVAPPEQMTQGQYALLRFSLKNVGGGVAHQIVVHHIPDDFTGELDESRALRDLAPSESVQTAFSIRPLVSGPVPLGIHVDYRDEAGEVVRITYRTRVDVAEPGTAVLTAALPTLSRTYADFDLLIGHPHRDAYPVRVLDAPAGEAQGAFILSEFDWSTIQAQVNGGAVSESTLRGWGRQLFEALFREGVGACFAASRAMTVQGQGLRLRLRVESGALAGLPWELLYDPQAGEFLALSARSPVVRHLPVARPAQLLALSPPLHMLAVVASPQDLATLDTQAEIAALRAVLQPLLEAGQMQLHVLVPPTAPALREYLLDQPCHLLHFVGHGAVDAGGGYLALEDEDKRADWRDAAAFCRLFGGQMPRFAMLNACLTAGDAVRACEWGTERAWVGLAPALVQAGVTAVVAMQFPVSDRGAQVFSADFYRMLARRKPIDEAIDQARIAVTAEQGTGGSDWAAPVLFLRGRSGDLFPGETRAG
ncbi:MAG: PQQ-binding-like beta-propeller repeat protein [Anaerolineae bacterium]|nr:PQQ-binding-like beta-propeller repeat protein [Anaerolineae bacterium]